MPSMSNRIRQVRISKKLSQSQLAAQVGVQRSAVAQWERHGAGTTPNMEHLIRVAVATGACIEWLATGRGPIYPEPGEFDVAAISHDFAHSAAESHLLLLFRQLSTKKQELACAIFEVMCR